MIRLGASPVLFVRYERLLDGASFRLLPAYWVPRPFLLLGSVSAHARTLFYTMTSEAASGEATRTMAATTARRSLSDHEFAEVYRDCDALIVVLWSHLQDGMERIQNLALRPCC